LNRNCLYGLLISLCFVSAAQAQYTNDPGDRKVESGEHKGPEERAAEEAKAAAEQANKPKVAAPVAGKQPYEFVRSISILQDQIVQGNKVAQTSLPRIITQIGNRLYTTDAQAWKDTKNARAIVSYILSGGQIRVARHVIEAEGIPPAEKRLIEGALAYSEGNEAKAKQLLMSFDPKKLPPTIAGHVALVQAILISKENLVKSNALLDEARLLAPGTLVEETALRRQIFNLASGTDMDRFVLLSSQYLRRFKNSIYADNFRANFYASVTRLGLNGQKEQFTKVAEAISSLSNEDQLRLYMSIAQAATFDGNMVISNLAAEKAMSIAKEGDADSSRAKLYEAATLVLTNSYEQGLAKLKDIDEAKLTKQDVELKKAILAMAKQIRQWSDVADPAGDEEPELNPKAVERDATVLAGSGSVIDLAQRALFETDQILQEPGH